MALVLAGVGVEDRHPAVAVAVGDVHLVGLGVDVDLGRLAEVGEVVAAFPLAVPADLQQELAVASELQDVGVVAAAAAEPDVVEVVDEDAVLRVGPLVALAGPAPCVHHVAGLVELDDRRGRTAALGQRRILVGAPLLQGEAAGTVHDPDVVAGVHRDPHHVAQRPVVGQRLRPGRVELERGRVRLSFLPAGGQHRRSRQFTADDGRGDHQHEGNEQGEVTRSHGCLHGREWTVLSADRPAETRSDGITEGKWPGGVCAVERRGLSEVGGRQAERRPAWCVATCRRRAARSYGSMVKSAAQTCWPQTITSRPASPPAGTRDTPRGRST